MVPFTVAAKLDLPVVDCDGMGRAFPELQVKGENTCFLGKITSSQDHLDDVKNNEPFLYSAYHNHREVYAL